MLENSSDVIGTGVVLTTLGAREGVVRVSVIDVVTLEALFAVAFVFSDCLGANGVSLDTLETLFAVAFALSLDTFEVFFAVAFAFSG